MKCKNCGAEISNDATICPYCDNLVQEKKLIENSNNVQNTTNTSSVTESKQTIIKNNIIGKKYSFASSKGANLRLSGLLMSRVLNDVEICENRITIETVPKRLNNVPVVFFEDITVIDVTTKINAYYWSLIILSVIAAFLTVGITLILTILFVLAGRDKKIRIAQRNGKDVIIYSRDFKMAEEFKNDICKLTNIK